MCNKKKPFFVKTVDKVTKVITSINVTIRYIDGGDYLRRTWLKEFRKAKGLTQSDVAEKANIERSYYTMIEAGNRQPSVTVAKGIGKTLGFDWTIFFNEKCNDLILNESHTA